MRQLAYGLCVALLILAGCQQAARSVKFSGVTTERIDTAERHITIHIERAAE